MDLDKFLKSQTFKTGMFVVLVLFVLLIVFKIGVISGYSKTNFSHKFDANRHRTGGTIFNHQRGTFDKNMFEKTILRRQFIIDKAITDSAEKSESDAVDIAE